MTTTLQNPFSRLSFINPTVLVNSPDLLMKLASNQCTYNGASLHQLYSYHTYLPSKNVDNECCRFILIAANIDTKFAKFNPEFIKFINQDVIRNDGFAKSNNGDAIRIDGFAFQNDEDAIWIDRKGIRNDKGGKTNDRGSKVDDKFFTIDSH